MTNSKGKDRATRAFEVGNEGEEAVANLFRKRGWDVEPGPVGGADLIIEGLVTVEVKTANPTGRVDRKAMRYQFCPFSHPEDQKPFEEHFVIPGCMVNHRRTKIDITRQNARFYRGQWAVFREAWQLVDLVIAGLLWLDAVCKDALGKSYREYLSDGLGE
jgi:hypothetical protein